MLRRWDLVLRRKDLSSGRVNTEPEIRILRKIKKCPPSRRQRNGPIVKNGLFFIINKEKTEPIYSISSVSLECTFQIVKMRAICKINSENATDKRLGAIRCV